MRQVGTLSSESDAQRFAAYLVTQGITAQAEQDSEEWAIWVRDEDQLDQANEEFEQFRIDPQAASYHGVEQQADTIRHQQSQKREEARKNIVEMRGKWGHGVAQQKSFTIVLIVLSALVSLGSDFADSRQGIGLTINRQLRFRDPASIQLKRDAFHDIKQGQLWRLVTPIFMHADWTHLIFNMFWLFYFGVQIESRCGAGKLALMVLFIAVFSNFMEALLPAAWHATPDGIGMSGVGFGLFGYVWFRMILRPTEGLYVSQFIVLFQIAYVILGLSGMLDRVMPNIDHWAHGLGLLAGIGLAYAAEYASQLKGK